MPCSASQQRLEKAASATVKSTATSTLAAVRAARSASINSWLLVLPIFPPAPSTPTRRAPAGSSGNGIAKVCLREGADHREHSRSTQHLMRHSRDLLARHRLDLRGHVLDIEHLTVQQQRGTDARHASAGVLETEQRVCFDVSLCETELAVGDAMCSKILELLSDESEHFVCVVRRGANRHRECTRILVRESIRGDRVAKAALFSDLLEQAGGEAATETVVEQRHRESLLRPSLWRSESQDQMRLLGVSM